MQRISSNWTLFLKIFLPNFWVVFFGLFTLAIWLTDIRAGGFSGAGFRIGATLFFLAGCAVLYLTLWQLKRIELDEQYLYASNYFKTYRYSHHDIEKISERNLGIFRLVNVFLKSPGHFGSKITFLLDEAMLEDFLEKHPGFVSKFTFK